MAPWLVFGAIELWISQHGFVRPDTLQFFGEILGLVVLAAAQANFAVAGTWRSPLLAGTFALAWSVMALQPSIVAWVGAVTLAYAFVLRMERFRRWGLAEGVLWAVLVALGSRYMLLDKASGGGSTSVARDPMTRLVQELSPPTWPAVAPTSDGPPMVLITIDTLRADNAQRMKSFELLADKGASWGDAMSTSSWTVPSVASLVTGLVPADHGAGVDSDAKLQGLSASTPTLAEALKGQGYATAAFTTNAWLAGGLGFDRGFDLYKHADADFHHRLALLGFPNGPKGHEAERVVDEALAWLDTAPPSGWFLWVHLIDPHLPYFHVEGALEQGLSDERLRAGMRHNPLVRVQVRNAYAAEVDYTDSHVNRLLFALSQRGVLDNGLVVLAADHGEEFWEHGFTGHGHQHHAEVVETGLAIAGLGFTKQARTDLVSIADVPSTMAAVAGIQLGKGLDLRQPTPDDRIVVSQGNAYFEQQRAARSKTMRAIFGSPEDPVGTCYDLVTDAVELSGTPCDPDDPVVQAARTATPPAHREGEAGMSAAQIKALQELGYVE
jgi:arylsulfatase A-like enzyme